MSRTATYHWRKLRLSILERDKYTCQSCGVITVVLEVDHIVPISDSNDNDPSNLQALCRPCHEKKTTEENKKTFSYIDHVNEMKKALFKSDHPS